MPPDGPARRDKQSLVYALRSGLAGGVAGCVAKTVVAPLDRVKILFQASNPDFQKYAGTWRGAFTAGADIYQRVGFRGLFQGHSATLLRIFPYAGIKFMAYDQIHLLLMPTRASETNVRRFIAGSLCGVISVFCTYPLELVRVRLAFQTRSIQAKQGVSYRPTLSSTISTIYSESKQLDTTTLTGRSKPALIARFPLLSFYRGFMVTVMGMIPYAGTSFLTWGYLRSIYVPLLPSGRSSRATPVRDLVIGAISGAISQTVSYPFEVIRRRMQVGGLTQPTKWMPLNETVASIWKKSGWRGFFVGLGIGYLKIIPMTAVSFAVWEGGKRFLDV